MSDPRPTARSVASGLLAELEAIDASTFADRVEQLTRNYNRLTAAIEADRAASDAREDRLREALERIVGRCEMDHGPDCACTPGNEARRALADAPTASPGTTPLAPCHDCADYDAHTKRSAPSCKCECHVPPRSDR